jgi:hypothetical protein
VIIKYKYLLALYLAYIPICDFSGDGALLVIAPIAVVGIAPYVACVFTVSRVQMSGSGGPPSSPEGAFIQGLGSNELVEGSLLNLSIQQKALFNEDLFEDLADDSNELLYNAEPQALYYPSAEMTSASVVSLMDSADLAEDSFLQALMQTARKTKHSTSQQQPKLRLKLLNFDGSSQQIEFSNEMEYWGLIAAIKKALDHNVGASYVGKCTLVAAGGDSGVGPGGTGIASASKGIAGFGVGGLFTQQQGERRCQLSGTQLSISSTSAASSPTSPPSGGDMKLDLQDVKALSLSADYDPVKNLLLEADLRTAGDELLGEKLCGIDTENNLISFDAQSINNRGDSVMTPVSIADLEAGRTSSGIAKLAVVRAGTTIGPGNNSAANNGSNNSNVVAEVNIPFDEFLKNMDHNVVSGAPSRVNASAICTHTAVDTNFVTPQKNKPGAGLDVVASPRARVDRPIVRQLTLKLTQQLPAAYRVVIRGAEGLPLEGKKAPSSYCTIYLVNDKSDRLTVNTVDARTDVSPTSIDPNWNKEFLLRYDGQDVSHRHSIHTALTDAPTGVMIKIRDAASGFLRHKHIGQVVVPISCFIYQTEATFTLPLDPTYRMTQGPSTLGEVHLLTELVSINPETGTIVRASNGSNSRSTSTAGSESTGATSVITPPRLTKANTFKRKEDETMLASASAVNTGRSGPGSPGRGSRRESKDMMVPSATGRFSVSEERSLTVHCCLRKASAWGTFWPMRTLSSGSVGAHGHVSCKPGSLTVRLAAGSAGPMALCEESKPFAGTAGVEAVEWVTEVKIPWSQVLAVIELSEAVLLVSVVIKSCISGPSDIAKQQLRYADAEVDLLVGPCPAMSMQLAMNHRVALLSVRNHLQSFIKTSTSLGFPLSERKQVISPRDSRVGPADEQLSRSPSMVLPVAAASSTSFSQSPPAVQPSPRGMTRKTSGSASSGVSKLADGNTAFGVNSDDMESLLQSVSSIAETLELHIFDNADHIRRFQQSSLQPAQQQRPMSMRPQIPLAQLQSQAPPASLMAVISSFSVSSTNFSLRPTKEQLFDYSKVCVLLRSVIYIAVLRSACRDIYTHALAMKLSAPVATSSAVTSARGSSSAGSGVAAGPMALLPAYGSDMVRKQCQEHIAGVVAANPIERNAVIDSLSRRLSLLAAACVRRLRELLLFAPSSNTNASVGTNVRSLALELVAKYTDAMKEALAPFTASRDVFLKVGSENQSGQLQLQADLLRFIITKNKDLDRRVALCLRLVDMARTDQPLSLSSPAEQQNLLDWFSASVSAQATVSFTKTLQQAKASRTNQYELAWDTQLNGSHVLVTNIPDSLQSALQPLLAMCVDEVDPDALVAYSAKMSPDSSKLALVGATSKSPTTPFQPSGSKGARDAKDLGLRAALIERDCELLALNDRILGCVARVYLRLGEEYRRVLQSRHWEQVTMS